MPAWARLLVGIIGAALIVMLFFVPLLAGGIGVGFGLIYGIWAIRSNYGTSGEDETVASRINDKHAGRARRRAARGVSDD